MYLSLGNSKDIVSFKEALFKGLAQDKSLYFPTQIDKLSNDFWKNLKKMNNISLGYEVLKNFTKREIPKENLFEIVEEKFSEIKNDIKPKKVNSVWTPGFIAEDRDLEQTQLVFGVEGLKNIDIDRFSLRALSIILGGGMSSRLFQEIREKRGLCYSIFSFTQMQNSCGVFGFYAGTSPNDVDQLLEASLIEWKKIKKFISSEELDRAKSQMKSGFIMGQESNSSRSEYFAKNMISFRKLIETKEVIRSIENISISSIYDLCEKLLNSAKPVLSVIGPNANSLNKLEISTILN